MTKAQDIESRKEGFARALVLGSFGASGMKQQRAVKFKKCAGDKTGEESRRRRCHRFTMVHGEC